MIVYNRETKKKEPIEIGPIPSQEERAIALLPHLVAARGAGSNSVQATEEGPERQALMAALAAELGMDIPLAMTERYRIKSAGDQWWRNKASYGMALLCHCGLALRGGGRWAAAAEGERAAVRRSGTSMELGELLTGSLVKGNIMMPLAMAPLARGVLEYIRDAGHEAALVGSAYPRRGLTLREAASKAADEVGPWEIRVVSPAGGSGKGKKVPLKPEEDRYAALVVGIPAGPPAERRAAFGWICGILDYDGVAGYFGVEARPEHRASRVNGDAAVIYLSRPCGWDWHRYKSRALHGRVWHPDMEL